jgi:hypothetical protein
MAGWGCLVYTFVVSADAQSTGSIFNFAKMLLGPVDKLFFFYGLCFYIPKNKTGAHQCAPVLLNGMHHVRGVQKKKKKKKLVGSPDKPGPRQNYNAMLCSSAYAALQFLADDE